MHFDLAHAIVTAIIVGAVVLIFGKKHDEDGGKRKWDWRVFAIVFVLIFILNLVWPYGTP